MGFKINHTEKIGFEKSDKIQLYFGKNGFGIEFFCYIRCGLNGYKKIKEDFLNKTSANPESYGEILYKDYLLQPDEKAKAFLANWLKNNA